MVKPRFTVRIVNWCGKAMGSMQKHINTKTNAAANKMRGKKT